MDITQESHDHRISCQNDIALIITTSPVPSIPSTQLVSDLLQSLPRCLQGCDIVLTFDGFKPCQDTSKLCGHVKRGQIPADLAARYPTYVANVKSLFRGERVPLERIGWGSEKVSTSQSQTQRVTFVEHARHLGFALSVKVALKYASRKYVMILQHDWVFEVDVDLVPLMQIMNEEHVVKYITFTTRSATDNRAKSHQRLKAVSSATKAMRNGKPLSDNLKSCFHFLDRPHLVAADVYRSIFNGEIGLTRLPFQFRRGDFTEDTLGTKYAWSIKNTTTDEQALQVWSQLGTWIYGRDDGERVLRHASGRLVLMRDDEENLIASKIEKNRVAKLNST